MIPIPKDAFTLTRFDSLLAKTTLGAGINLITNPGFELDFAAWGTATNWSAVAADSVTPNGLDDKMAQASSASKSSASTLESSRVAVSGQADYVVSFLYGSPSNAPKKANNLTVTVNWWNASPGGSLVRADVVLASPLRPNKNGMRIFTARITSPAGATYASFKARNVYGAAVTGASYGALLDNVLLAGVITTPTLTGLETLTYGGNPIYFRNLKFGWHYQTGCKRKAFRVYGPAEYLTFLLDTALGQHVEMSGLGTRVFGGMLWSMFGQIGARSMGVTLDSLANYIKVPYRDTYAVQADAESILRYGRKDLIADKQFSTMADALGYGNLLLSEMAFPRPTADDGGGAGGADFLDIEVMGYFANLQWTTGLAPTFIGAYDTSQVIATMPATVFGNKSLLGRVGQDSPNDFYSSDYALVETTGKTAYAPQNAGARTSQEMLLELVGLGTSANKGLVCGVDDARRFFMRQRPTTRAYTRVVDTDGKFSFYDAAGNEVARPLVRCGEFVTDGAPVPSFNVIRGADAARDPMNRFITETEYDHENNDMRVTLAGKRRLGLDLSRALRRRK